ncbi:MAG: universal stress protein [Polyangiaceae bacterium]
MTRKLLCPVDFSECSEHAFRAAVDLAARLGVTVQVFHIYQPSEVSADPGFFLYAGNQRPLSEIARDQATRGLDEFAEAHADVVVGVNYSVLEGHPVERILEEARTGAYEMIVMGTRGRTGLAHLLMGSVAERVVRGSPIPVFTFKEATTKDAP